MIKMKLNKNILHIGLTTLLSLLFTGMTAIMSDFLLLFIFFFITFYLLGLLFENIIIREISKHKFYLGISDILSEMVKQGLTQREFKFIYIKINSVKDIFYKKLSLTKAFNSFIYNPIKEYKKLEDITSETVKDYCLKWREESFGDEEIKEFNNIHNINTEKYFNKLKRLYNSKASIYERQRVITEGLLDLLFESIEDYRKIKK